MAVLHTKSKDVQKGGDKRVEGGGWVSVWTMVASSTNILKKNWIGLMDYGNSHSGDEVKYDQSTTRDDLLSSVAMVSKENEDSTKGHKFTPILN